MNACKPEADTTTTEIGGVTLLRLALFGLDQAHRLSFCDAARCFDQAALALVASDSQARAYAELVSSGGKASAS
jgi:hypothetical protein